MHNANQGLVGFTGCLSYATVAVGSTQGSTGTINTTGTTTFAIDGVLYTLGAQTSAVLIPGKLAAVAQAINTTCLYLLQVNAAGTISAVKGKEVLTTDLSSGGKVLEWPQSDDKNAVFGYLRVVTGATAGATFTLGATSLSAANVTTTYGNLIDVPSAPLTS